MSFVFQDLEIVHNPSLNWKFSADQFERDRLLVWVTYYVDMRLFGKNAGLWRMTNGIFHILTAGLLVMLSPLAALLFVVHPLTLMGSSYVAGRAGVLSAIFQIAAALLAISGFILAPLALAVVASKWLKRDSLILFPMIAALWWTR